MEIVGRLLDRLFPGSCPGCGAAAPARVCRACWQARPVHPAMICRRCAGRLPCPDCPAGTGKLTAVLALGPYKGLWEHMIRLFKYHGRKDLARPLGGALAGLAGAAWP
ncbi:MAG: hypothetical protein FJZ01_26880, partial [Candidatus Sericytochromatia bacterium]|nr:hypothetical protein [Candidatus Tanganyikabacteria bacterium]